MVEDVVPEGSTRNRAKSPALVEVTVQEKRGQSAMIQWTSEDGFQKRAFLPVKALRGETKRKASVESDDLNKALNTPFGEPWETRLKKVLPEEQANAFADALRLRGIWTLDDLPTHPNGYRLAIEAVFGFESLLRGGK